MTKDVTGISLADRIQLRLAVLGLSARKASVAANCNPETIRNICRRNVMPSALKLENVSRALETTPAYLLGLTDDPGVEGRTLNYAAGAEDMRRSILKIIGLVRQLPLTCSSDAALENLARLTAIAEPCGAAEQ